MINKVGIQLYSDLVIFCMFLFIKSPPGPWPKYILCPCRRCLTKMMTKGNVPIQFSEFLSLLVLDLVTKLHKAVPGSVPALREVPAGRFAAHLEGFPNARSFS